MNVKAITNEAIITAKNTGLKKTNKLAGILLGTFLLFSSGALKANEPQNDTFQKEKTEFVSEDSGNKTLVGESLLGGVLLTYIGLCLHSLQKKKQN